MLPKDFIWGAAASSYQVEGAAWRDGGGASVWDMLGRQPGRINNGDSGEVACDHYHRYREDVGLMAGIGLQAYRFSVSWPRVLPHGAGAVNAKGLDFYSRLVDELLEHGITPWLTLFHWDFPYALYCKGGWLNRDSAGWFADYSAILVDKLSDRVAHWITLNEPQCFIGMGHLDGTHAPGVQMGFAEALLAGHHALLAHGQAVQVIRARAKMTPLIGAAQAGTVALPENDQPQQVEAARTAMFSIREKMLFNNSWFSDPMILGCYPQDGVELFAADMPEISSGDLASIAQPLDFYGANIYSGYYVCESATGDYEKVINRDCPVTAMDWPITPEALYWGPRYIYERYKLPIVVTENGMATDDQLENGKIHDQPRIDFLQQYISQFSRAIAGGVPGLGYFLWSIMDNFEWAEGYAKRFGLIHVDYATQQRTLKDSANWYRQVIAANGGNLKRVSGHISD
ncbi:MAG: GH1 family beta-glucosidase [Gammaproteobacteria bacterium]